MRTTPPRGVGRKTSSQVSRDFRSLIGMLIILGIGQNMESSVSPTEFCSVNFGGNGNEKKKN